MEERVKTVVEELVDLDTLFALADEEGEQDNEQTEAEEEEEEYQDKGVVNSVSDYLGSFYKVQDNQKYAGYTVEELLEIFHDKNRRKEERDEAKQHAFFKLYFLLPYIIGKRFKLNRIYFEEMLQNMSECVWKAMDSYNPRMGFKLTQYLPGYIQSAVVKTFQGMNAVTVATYKKQDDPEMVSYVGIELNDTDEATLPQFDFEENAHKSELLEWVEELLSPESSALTSDEKRVLLNHFGVFGYDRKDYKKIADFRRVEGRGAATSRISQIKKKALEKLRAKFIELGIEQ